MDCFETLYVAACIFKFVEGALLGDMSRGVKGDDVGGIGKSVNCMGDQQDSGSDLTEETSCAKKAVENLFFCFSCVKDG